MAAGVRVSWTRLQHDSLHSLSPFPGFEDKDIFLKEGVDNQEPAE